MSSYAILLLLSVGCKRDEMTKFRSYLYLNEHTLQLAKGCITSINVVEKERKRERNEFAQCKAKKTSCTVTNVVFNATCEQTCSNLFNVSSVKTLSTFLTKISMEK